VAPIDQLGVENNLRDVVEAAVGQYLTEVRRRVFSVASRPDWALWPSTLWPQIMAAEIVPRMQRIYEDLLVSQGVDKQSAAAYGRTFAGSLNDLINDPHIPDRVFSQVQGVVFSQSYAQGDQGTLLDELLIASAVLWVGMITVMAINAASLVWNGATYTAAIEARDRNPDARVLKTWIARDDDRTRITHRLVDNTTIGVTDTFTVGGFPLRFPHDPFGPPQEIMNCRCGLTFGVENG